MTKQHFLEYCLTTYNTSPDYPFDEDFETAVLRHADNRKWYAIVMKVSRRKFGFDSDEVIDVVNLKLLPDAPEDVVRFLVNVSFEETKNKRKRQKNI